MKSNDYGTYPVSKIVPPPMGETYIDPVFTTPVKRLTDASKTEDVAYGDGRRCWSCQTEYATVNPFSALSTWLLIQHGGSGFAVYDGTGKFQFYPLNNGHYDVTASAEPRWTYDPNVFVYIYNNEIRAYDCSKRSVTILHVFSEYVNKLGGVRGLGEGDISPSGEVLSLCGQRTNGTFDLFLFNVKTGVKGAAANFASQTFNNVYVTPSGQLLVGFTDPGAGLEKGQWIYSRTGAPLLQLSGNAAHNDVGLDSDGSDVMIWPDGGNPTSMGGPVCSPTGMARVSLVDATKKCILSFPNWDTVMHTYVPSTPGWFLLSTYTSPALDPAVVPTIKQWPFMNEIFRMSMDGKTFDRLCHHQSSPITKEGYTRQPRATGNKDLSKIVFNSGMSAPAVGSTPNYCDVYMMDLPRIQPTAAPVQPIPVQGIGELTINGQIMKVKEMTFTNGQWLILLQAKDGKLTARMFDVQS